MKNKSPLNWKVQLAFGSAFLTLLVVGAISYRGMVVSSESDRWVRHTHEVLENLQDLLSAAQRIESSYRGFALTGEDRFLEPYHDSLLRVAQDEATVRNLTVDNPIQPSKGWLLRRSNSARGSLACAGQWVWRRQRRSFEAERASGSWMIFKG
jgi:CHASE3 domain sensor protein